MAKVAANADAYAVARIGIFFTADNQTPKDGNLTGQCVTLNKWFLSEMTTVPNPFAARGDARYVGKRLVAEGHAVEVPYDQRKPGDFVVYEYGQYGHIGVLLKNDRIFEQNVNVGGVARRLVEGAYVYASRIGSLSESWRPVRPNIYRIKSYNEVEDEPMIDKNDIGILRIAHTEIAGWGFNDVHSGKKDSILLAYWKGKPVRALINHQWKISSAYRKNREAWRNFYNQYSNIIGELKARPTQKELADAMAKITQEAAKVAAADQKAAEAIRSAQAALEKQAKLEQEKADAEQTGNAFLRWLGDQLNKLLGK